MENASKYQIILFFIPMSFLTILFFSFYINNNYKTALLATLITWSAYILCVPAFHGKIILGIPYKIIFGKKILYPEKIIWPLAMFLNLITLIYFKPIYYTTIITHLFYEILTNPWPFWLIIFTSFFGTFYRSIIGYEKFFDYKIINYFFRTIIVLLGIFVLAYLSYDELIILLNIMV